MAKGTDEIAADVTAAWIAAMSLVAAEVGTALGRQAHDQLSAENVAKFYERIYGQIVMSRNA